MTTKQFEKRKGIAAILSVWLPGLGQLYNRQYIKAAIIFSVCMWFSFESRDAWHIWLMFPWWILNIRDAYKNG